MKSKERRDEPKVPNPHDWRTTDADEIARRRLRAREEQPRITNLDPRYRIFSNFKISSPSGMYYTVEIRSLSARQFSCTCVDFRINGLGTCKHVEATLAHLQARYPRLFAKAAANGGRRPDVVADPVSGMLRIEGPVKKLPGMPRGLIGEDGAIETQDPAQALNQLGTIPEVRISQDVAAWLESAKRAQERIVLRREYEQRVQSGEWPAQETRVPLYPYQREGMLHLAFVERALLADEMGLGKTIQAIAACALLHRLGKAQRVLVVAPASLKTEWEEQIQRFTNLPYQLIYGARRKRLRHYGATEFFTVTNYEQMLTDAPEINEILRPDIVILDEAQRIKNWTTKTAQSVKRLRSRYAFVLTGTPIENRIDELHSLMDFLNPSVLGPLFRFNRDFYVLDDRGRPSAYRNLEQLHARIKPYMLRRRKADVETELPDRTDRTFFVPLSPEQKDRYGEHEAAVARILAMLKRRPLTQQEQDKLMRELAMMRMTCDTNYILDPNDRACPKLAELEKILEECRDNPETKVLVFSEWERMIQLVRELCERLEIQYALHTGSIPQLRRRGEIRLFKSNPACKVFLSTDSGSTGLNLQDASVVINCDLPWNPARLEQRIARAWRKHQKRSVTVIHLVSENTIEHRMLSTLAGKQALADGVLDLRGDLSAITLVSGKQAFLRRLQHLMTAAPAVRPIAVAKPLPSDRPLAFSRRAKEQLGGALVSCEERYPVQGPHSVIVAVVDRDADVWRQKLAPLHEELFGKDRSDPLAPVKLEVIDRATAEAMQRLIEAGLIGSAVRATRGLYPEAEDGNGVPALSDEERQKASALRAQSSRKFKMARLLAGGDLVDEARQALLEAVLFMGRALAVENRLTEPAEVNEATALPAAICWKGALPAVRGFVSAPEQELAPVLGELGKMLEATSV